MKNLAVLTLVAALAAVEPGCDRGGAPPASAKPRKLFWVQALKGHPVHQMTQLAFTAGCRKLGYEAVVVGTDGPDIAGTIALAEQALASGEVAGMAVWTGNPAYQPLMERAAKKGIPVVLPHFPVPEGSAPGARGVISCDPARYAAEAARRIGERIDGKGAGAITQGSFNTTENLVAETFAKALKDGFPGARVLPPVEEGFDAAAAISKAVSILQANADLAAAFSTTGGGPVTWAGAQREAGRKIVVVGMDYTRVNLDLVKGGEVFGVIGQPLWEESHGAAELLDRLLRGETIDWWTKLEAPFLGPDGLDSYYALLDRVEAAIRK